MHYGGSERNIKLNFGTFIKYAINEFNNKYKNENDNKQTTAKEITIKYKIGKEDKIKIIFR